MHLYFNYFRKPILPKCWPPPPILGRTTLTSKWSSTSSRDVKMVSTLSTWRKPGRSLCLLPELLQPLKIQLTFSLFRPDLMDNVLFWSLLVTSEQLLLLDVTLLVISNFFIEKNFEKTFIPPNATLRYVYPWLSRSAKNIWMGRRIKNFPCRKHLSQKQLM